MAETENVKARKKELVDNMKKQKDKLCGSTLIDKEFMQYTMAAFNEVVADLMFSSDAAAKGNPNPMLKTYLQVKYAQENDIIPESLAKNVLDLMHGVHKTQSEEYFLNLDKDLRPDRTKAKKLEDPEKRFAADGQVYTKAEFLDKFGEKDGESRWKEARQAGARYLMMSNDNNVFPIGEGTTWPDHYQPILLEILRAAYKTVGQNGKEIKKADDIFETNAWKAWAAGPGGSQQKKLDTLANSLACARMQIDSNTSEGDKKPKKKSRLAVIGVESAGKSFFLNHLVNPKKQPHENGKLPSAEGMGTQVCCLLGQKPKDQVLRSIRYGGPKLDVSSDAEINHFIDLRSKEIAAKKKSGFFDQGLDTKLIIVQDELFGSDADVTQEFIDVPGLKEETRMQSVLALSTATGVAICTTNAKALDADFKGKLSILKEIIEQTCSLTARDRLPITVVFTRDIPEDQGGSVLDLSRLDEEKEAVRKAMESAGLLHHYKTAFFGNFSRLNEVPQTPESFATEFMRETATDAAFPVPAWKTYEKIRVDVGKWMDCLQSSIEEKVKAKVEQETKSKKGKAGKGGGVLALLAMLDFSSESYIKNTILDHVGVLKDIRKDKFQDYYPDQMPFDEMEEAIEPVNSIKRFENFSKELHNRVRLETLDALKEKKTDLSNTVWEALQTICDGIVSKDGDRLLPDIVEFVLHSIECSRATLQPDIIDSHEADWILYPPKKGNKNKKNKEEKVEEQDIRRWSGHFCKDLIAMCREDKLFYLFAGRNIVANDEVVKLLLGSGKGGSEANWFEHDTGLCKNMKDFSMECKAWIRERANLQLEDGSLNVEDEVIKRAREIAVDIFKRIQGTEIFDPDLATNDAAAKLVTMGKEVFLRLFVENDISGEGNVGWTEFAEYVRASYTESPLTSMINEFTSAKSSIKGYKNAFNKIEGRRIATGKDIDMSSLKKQKRKVDGYFQADALGEKDPIRVQIVAIQAKWCDEDVVDVVESAADSRDVTINTQVVPRSKDGMIQDNDDLVNEIKRFCPQVLLVLRNEANPSKDLGSDEKDILNELCRLITTSHIVLVQPNKMKKEPHWDDELEDGLGNCKLVNVNVQHREEDDRIRLNPDDPLKDAMIEVLEEVRPILKKNENSAIVVIQNYAIEFKALLREQIEDEAREFAALTPSRFYNDLLDRNKKHLEKAAGAKKGALELPTLTAKFPSEDVLRRNFISVTGGIVRDDQHHEAIIDEQGLKRHLRTLVICQLMTNLKLFGEYLYDKEIGEFKRMACEFFSDGEEDRLDSMLMNFKEKTKFEEMERKANDEKTKGKRPVDEVKKFIEKKGGAGRYFKLASDILDRENFALMYCGCFAQSLIPYVDGVLRADFLDSNQFFDDEKALEYAVFGVRMYRERIEETTEWIRPKSMKDEVREMLGSPEIVEDPSAVVADLRRDNAELARQLEDKKKELGQLDDDIARLERERKEAEEAERKRRMEEAKKLEGAWYYAYATGKKPKRFDVKWVKGCVVTFQEGRAEQNAFGQLKYKCEDGDDWFEGNINLGWMRLKVNDNKEIMSEFKRHLDDPWGPTCVGFHDPAKAVPNNSLQG